MPNNYYNDRIRKIYEDAERNKIDSSNLKKKRVKLEPVHYIKRKRKIEIGDFLLVTGFNEFRQTFVNFPELAITNAKVVCQFYTAGGYSIEGLLPGAESFFQWQFFHAWKYKADRQYNLTMTVKFTNLYKRLNPESESYTSVPIFCKLYVVFYNQRTYNEIQHKKT